MPKKRSAFPVPAVSIPESTVNLSSRGAARVKAGHPWVYRSDLECSDSIAPGALVRVLDPRGRFIGTALYSSSSQIAVRMMARDEVNDLAALVSERIRGALIYRQQFVADTNAYRIVFSEADSLPGLIIDRYNDVISVQILTQAMDAEPIRGAIVETLVEQLHPGGIVERVDPRIRELEQLPPRESALLWGRKSETVITMNAHAASSTESLAPNAQSQGIHFHFNALEGQKTGAFLDQRENYAAAARYAGGRALDVFCYQGGFALHLAPHYEAATGVDSSRPALEMAEQNAALNHKLLNGKEIEWIEANAFDLLRDYAAAGQKYDIIVLDPPAFAKSKRDLPKALSGYKELNLRALKMLAPGGILVTCSCSFHVGPADFLETVADAARDAHKSLRLLENRGAAKDHPQVLAIPETGYLKCMIFYVTN